jgi:hypothetical protein
MVREITLSRVSGDTLLCHYVARARYISESVGSAALHPRLLICDRYAVLDIQSFSE